MTAMEKRIALELEEGNADAPAHLLETYHAPTEPNSSCTLPLCCSDGLLRSCPDCSWVYTRMNKYLTIGEPIFKAASAPARQVVPAHSVRKEATVSRRMASLEKKVGCLQSACLAMEEESSNTAVLLSSIEVCARGFCLCVLLMYSTHVCPLAEL